MKLVITIDLSTPRREDWMDSSREVVWLLSQLTKWVMQPSKFCLRSFCIAKDKLQLFDSGGRPCGEMRVKE